MPNHATRGTEPILNNLAWSIELPESPHLTEAQLEAVRRLLTVIRRELMTIANEDNLVLHHARRYLQKRLEFDERSTPNHRGKLKLTLMAKQQGQCAICGGPLPAQGAELDRADAVLGYTEDNCRLIHHDCHRNEQAKKNFR